MLVESNCLRCTEHNISPDLVDINYYLLTPSNVYIFKSFSVAKCCGTAPEIWLENSKRVVWMNNITRYPGSPRWHIVDFNIFRNWGEQGWSYKWNKSKLTHSVWFSLTNFGFSFILDLDFLLLLFFSIFSFLVCVIPWSTPLDVLDVKQIHDRVVEPVAKCEERDGPSWPRMDQPSLWLEFLQIRDFRWSQFFLLRLPLRLHLPRQTGNTREGKYEYLPRFAQFELWKKMSETTLAQQIIP